MLTNEFECYISRRSCGCIVMAVVNHPAHYADTAKELAKAVKHGETIERVTCQYVRDNMRICTHKAQRRNRAKQEKASK